MSREIRGVASGHAFVIALPLVLAVDAAVLTALLRGAHLVRALAILVSLAVCAVAWPLLARCVDGHIHGVRRTMRASASAERTDDDDPPADG